MAVLNTRRKVLLEHIASSALRLLDAQAILAANLRNAPATKTKEARKTGEKKENTKTIESSS